MAKRKRVKLKRADVDQLRGMGFPEDVCEDALKRHSGDVEQALNWLLDNAQTFSSPNPNPPPEETQPPAPKKRKGNSGEVIREDDQKDPLPSEEEKAPPPPSPAEQAFAELEAEYSVERTKLEEAKEKALIPLKTLERTAAKLAEIRYHSEFPESTDPDFLWLKQKLDGLMDHTDAETGKLKQQAKNFDEEIACKETIFLKKKQEFEDQQMIARLYDEDLQSGRRMTIDERNIHLLTKNNKKIEKEYSCSICFCEYPLSEYAILDCLHGFCQNCIAHTIKAKVDDGMNGIALLTCPHVCPKKGNCKHKFTHEEVRLFLKGEEKHFEQYEKLQLHQTLNQAEDCGWCPHPGCETAMFKDGDSPMLTCPKCEMKFCFNCKTTEWHTGSSCAQFQQWKKDNDQADAKFEEWKKSNTAPCPKCKTCIEKNGGCMHMTCSNCRFEFHWVTREKWRGYEANYAVSWQANPNHQRPPNAANGAPPPPAANNNQVPQAVRAQLAYLQQLGARFFS